MGSEHRLDDSLGSDEAFDWRSPARALGIPTDEARALYRKAVRKTTDADPRRAEELYLGWLEDRGSEERPSPPGRATLAMQESPDRRRGSSLRQPSAPGRRTLTEELDDAQPQPLPAEARTRMEGAFGQSFADVRLHSGGREVQAGQKAVTRGRDIFLEAGAVELGSEQGDEVLAHELAHVAQHEAPAHPRTASPGVAWLEADARRAAKDALAGQPAAVRFHAPSGLPLGFSETPRTGTAPQRQARGGPGSGGAGDAGGGASGARPGVDGGARAGFEARAGAPPAPAPAGAPTERATPAGPDSPRGERGGATPRPQPAGAANGRAPAPAAGPATGPATATAPARGAAGAGGADSVLLPEAPAALTPAAQARLHEVGAQNQTAAAATTELPTAQQSTAQARGAVEEPQAEQDARAQAAVVTEVDDRPPPSPEIEAACERIREVIRSKRPPDEDRLVEAQPREMAQEAGQQMSAGVEARAGSVRDGYADMQGQPQGQPSRPPMPVELPPEQVAAPPVDAAAGAPEALAPSDVSLEQDVAAQQQRIEGAGMTTEPAQLVQDGPIAEARGGLGELEQMAQTDPQRVLAEQAAAVTQARGDMQALQAAAEQLLQQARSGAVQDLGTHSTGVTGTEEQKRAQAGAQMQAIFQRTQQAVDRLLQPLGQTALARWNAGIDTLSTAFETSLASVKQRIEARYATEDDWNPLDEIGATITRWGDETFGLPDWVVEEYDRAEAAFADGATDLIRDISRDVNAVIQDCQALIQQARRDIDAIVQSLPEELQAWAQGEAARLGQQLDALDTRVTEAQSNLNRDLIDRANTAVQEVRERVHELRVAAGGLLGRIASAIEEFLRDPARAIVNGLLQLVGIPPANFWALVERLPNVISGIAEDPLGFANTLMAGVGQGFQQFFDNFPGHIGHALFQWLFSRLGEAGVAMPPDFSPRSILGLVLDVLGISWPRIRTILARHIGEQNAQLLDQAYQVIATLIERGPQGLIDMFVEQLDPSVIVDMLLQTALNYVIEAIVTRVAARILLMLNPAGAILQAIEAIYRVLRWIIDNAARIFTLIESIVNGAAAILAGDTGGVANLVEQSLVRLMVPVIDFLAGYLGLGGIPEAIRDLILGLQSRVEAILDRVIGFIADRARALLRSVRGSGQGEQTDREEVPVPSSIVEPRPATLDRISPELAQALATAAPGTILYQRNDADPRQVTNALLASHRDAHFDHATGQLTLSPISEDALERARSLDQLGAEIARETGVSKVTLERDGDRIRFEAHINPHTSVGTLNINDLRPGVGKKILLLGEADFSFARSLANQNGGAGMVATSYEGGDAIRDQYRGAASNIQGAEENGVQIVHGVDAQNIDPNLGGPPSAFQYIVFNFPFVPGPRATAAARNRTMLAAFLVSASAALERGGRIFVTSKEYWLARFHLTESAGRAGLRWVNPTSLPGHEHDEGEVQEGQTGLGFDASQFPGYGHRETHADLSAEGTENAITLIFTK